MSKALIFTIMLALLAPWRAWAQEETETDQFLRENPDFDISQSIASDEMPQRLVADYDAYPFLHLHANQIQLNGADWSGLRQQFALSADTLISIVHIGDSHIQAEGATSRTRSLLQTHYGSAGRGLIIPYRLAGTNQPLDYSITSKAKFETAKIMKKPWPVEMGFTGISIRPKQKRYDITLATKPINGINQDFEVVRIYATGDLPIVVGALSAEGENNLFESYSLGDTISVFLRNPASEVTLQFQGRGNCDIFGFDLDNEMMGVKYSAIGNNGATYSAYNSIGYIGRGVKTLEPDLIIVSLGANEAFGTVDNSTFYNNIDVLVRDLQADNPQAQILLVTPSECQRAKTKRTGRKRRVKTYSVNSNVPRLREVVLRYGRDHGIATYDWYDVAGGAGSSEPWLNNKLMNTDRIHNTWDGYALQGSLFYDALIQAIHP